MFAAEVRRRAADDDSYLLPVRRIVKEVKSINDVNRLLLFALNVGLVDDLAIFFLLLAQMSREFG